MRKSKWLACLRLERRPLFWVDFDLAVSVFGAPGKTLAKQDLLLLGGVCRGKQLQQQQNGYKWQASKQNSYIWQVSKQNGYKRQVSKQNSYKPHLAGRWLRRQTSYGKSWRRLARILDALRGAIMPAAQPRAAAPRLRGPGSGRRAGWSAVVLRICAFGLSRLPVQVYRPSP